jgi:hypothetical protein
MGGDDTTLEGTDSQADAMPAAFTCDLTAIAPAERGAHQELIRRVVSEAVGDIVDLADGVALRFRADAYETVVRFVAGERLCCPFLTVTLEISPARGALWLRLTGPAGIKEFLRAELHLPTARG